MNKKCPLTALKDDCIEHGCVWWVGVMGKDKNTGLEGLQESCAVTMLIKTSLEQAYTNIGIAASLDKVVNQQEKSSLVPALVSIANTLHEAKQKQVANGEVGNIGQPDRYDQIPSHG